MLRATRPTGQLGPPQLATNRPPAAKAGAPPADHYAYLADFRACSDSHRSWEDSDVDNSVAVQTLTFQQVAEHPLSQPIENIGRGGGI